MFKKLNSPQIIVISFLAAILMGTVLLNTPFATKSGERLDIIDCLFTATSATCVTGLIVRDTGAYFSGFGQFIILFLIQIGGLSIMFFSTLFAVLLGRRITIQNDVVIQKTIGITKVHDVARLLRYILFITLGIELIGAISLAVRWKMATDLSLAKVLINSVFHSVSAFCNAGFSLFSKNLAPFAKDPYINLTIISLIVIGGLGFVVILELMNSFKRRSFNKLTIQAKLVLIISFALIASGTIVIFFAEKTNSMIGFSLKEKILGSLFQSVTARTAGFNTIDIGKLTMPSLSFIVFLMFIGASPGSTGGGLKTCTFGILVATAVAMLKNRDRVFLFRKTIPKEVVRKSLVVLFLVLAWISVATFLLTVTESKNSAHFDNFFLRLLFEATSAFGTVGLSANITPTLTALGKLIIILTMFAGRVGLLTLVLAVALREDKTAYSYSEEKSIMIS